MTSSTFRIGGEIGVRRIGFGAMRLATEAGAAREASIAVARRAVELGVTLIDTAFMYGWGANEELLVEALHPYPDDLLIATKVAIEKPQPGEEASINGRPEFLREQVEQALRRLRVERIGLLQMHRLDPKVPLADQLGTLREFQLDGRIGHIGLSEVTVDELDEARGIVDVASVQNRYSLLDREHEAVLDACDAAGIAFLPWRPVHPAASTATAEIAAVAAELDATAAQVALAWLLDRSPVVLPIPGTASLDHLAENVAAGDLRLSDEQRRRLDGITLPTAG
ncbi:aldo/keto reductase [Streptomyces durmitorensis]|uniref:Aldo/keto reductase n=1 Tax=Streptomyces durmitorensis TaxID=319947 RepID=A0ABY4PLB7_9ACTN|nr:aldo/keto reductase [Streptomyces durmitorensis]UQT54155.1 aldo/keto reductase [Streptomyces durmitorensis]